MKILAIGNSFSQDATTLMESLCDGLFVRNLDIGGCSLQTHCENVRADAAAYQYQQNGKQLGELKSVSQALQAEKWDWVTVQQVSGLAGIEESYEPYISELTAYIRARTDAKIAFHRTWAYEKDSTHPDFAHYGNSQSEMWKKIRAATDTICRKERLPIIDVGAVIAKLREQPFFDAERGGIRITRDGFHLSYEYGRVAAACTWIKFFTGTVPPVLQSKDAPEGYAYIDKAVREA